MDREFVDTTIVCVYSVLCFLCSGRMQFMLDIITSLRTNNPQKIPGYDPDRIENMRKLLRTHIKGIITLHSVLCDQK